MAYKFAERRSQMILQIYWPVFDANVLHHISAHEKQDIIYYGHKLKMAQLLVMKLKMLCLY